MKVAELEGIALDYWVAKAEGRFRDQLAGYYGLERDCEIDVAMFERMEQRRPDPFKPSTHWAQGGPLLDRFPMRIAPAEAGDGDRWCVTPYVPGRHPDEGPWYWGPTMLIAAMRCLVASKFGEEVNNPLDQKLADRLVRDFGKP